MGLCIDPRRRRFLYSAGATPQLLPDISLSDLRPILQVSVHRQAADQTQVLFQFREYAAPVRAVFLQEGTRATDAGGIPGVLRSDVEFVGVFQQEAGGVGQADGQGDTDPVLGAKLQGLPDAAGYGEVVHGGHRRGAVQGVHRPGGHIADRRPEHPGLQEWQAGHHHERGGGTAFS